MDTRVQTNIQKWCSVCFVFGHISSSSYCLDLFPSFVSMNTSDKLVSFEKLKLKLKLTTCLLL